jgi:Asp-tRNA(Asn)/Glu-tRNA(Gln) amidotransferase A subunit family amidase
MLRPYFVRASALLDYNRLAMSNELIKLSATALAQLIREKKVSPVEVVEAYLQQIEKENPKLNAIVTLAPDAIEQAKESKEKIISSEDVGLLHGVPVTIKDTIATKNLRTTCGSKRFADNVPNEDATVVSLLKKAGAIIIGKTNTAELAMALDCDNPLFGRTNNPHDLTKTSGGSSGGDAAAVAANMTPIGIGSDLMGSIRVPSHFCGVFGLKPTTGSVSMRGHIPKAEGVYSLGSVIGPIARSVEDLALAFSIIANQEIQNSKFKIQNSKQIKNRNAAGKSKISILRPPHSALHTWKVAFFTSDGISPVTNEIKEAVHQAAKLFEGAGFVVEEKTPPHIERSAELWRRLFLRGGLHQLKEIYEGHEEDAGGMARAILKRVGSMKQSLDDFLSAWIERDRLRYKLMEWMGEYPLIIAPVGSVAAFEHGARRVDVDGISLNIMQAFSYCQAWNVFGFPSVCVPITKTKDGLPIGVQLISLPFSENELLGETISTITDRR